MFNSLKIGDNDMKKMMILAVMMVMTISAKAMSYNAAITVVPATSEVAAKVIPFCSTICLETRTPGNLRNEVPFFAERICGFVDFISVVLMEIVLLHLKY